MNEFLDNLKRQAALNPTLAVGVAAAAITAIAKLMNASSEARNSKTWHREVKRRERTSRS